MGYRRQLLVSSVDRGEGSEGKAIPALISHSFRAHGAPQRNQDLLEQGLGRWDMLWHYFTVVSLSQKGCLFLSKVKIIYVGGAGTNLGFVHARQLLDHGAHPQLPNKITK